uniref:Uncharacterized protein n=1 Tax=Anguilla anguilla TaxID=7936 RepID=A0A0E9WUU1_ANGAN
MKKEVFILSAFNWWYNNNYILLVLNSNPTVVLRLEFRFTHTQALTHTYACTHSRLFYSYVA